MNIGFLTDIHARADTPQGRIDDFRTSLYTKLEECSQIWRDEKVEVIAFGGDMFDTPDPTTSVVYDIMHILKSWQLPIIGIIGSHDHFGYQVKTLKRTAIGLLEKAGLIELIDEREGFRPWISYPSNVDNTVVRFVGNPHTYWLDKDPHNFEKERIAPEHDLQIQLVHGDLLDKAVIWEHVLVSQVHTASDLVLIGHYHPGWKDPIIIESTTFINPGSIGRLDNTGKHRIPRVCIINVKRDKQFTTKFRELKTAIPHPFKEKIEIEEEQPKDIEKLISLIEGTELSAIDIKSQLPKVAEQAGFSQEVIEKAFQLIERAEN